MRKSMVTLTLTVAGSMMCAANAISLTNQVLAIPRESSLDKVGCERAGDNCPYGYRIERHGGKGWSCEPCWKRGEDYEPRRYRDDYGERRYRHYEDERYYEPRRYPREYY
jgi:hypothetical protein